MLTLHRAAAWSVQVVVTSDGAWQQLGPLIALRWHLDEGGTSSNESPQSSRPWVRLWEEPPPNAPYPTLVAQPQSHTVPLETWEDLPEATHTSRWIRAPADTPPLARMTVIAERRTFLLEMYGDIYPCHGINRLKLYEWSSLVTALLPEARVQIIGPPNTAPSSGSEEVDRVQTVLSLLDTMATSLARARSSSKRLPPWAERRAVWVRDTLREKVTLEDSVSLTVQAWEAQLDADYAAAENPGAMSFRFGRWLRRGQH